MLVTSVSLCNKDASINSSRAKRVANVQNTVSFQRSSSRSNHSSKIWMYVTAALAGGAVIFGNIDPPGQSKLNNSQATFLATYGSGFEGCEKALMHLEKSEVHNGSLLKNICGFRINR